MHMIIVGQLFTEKQIVQRTERAILFDLINRHFLTVDRQFDKTAPAIKLMGADFPDIFGITVGTSHHPSSPITFRISRLVFHQHPLKGSGHQHGIFADGNLLGSFRQHESPASFQNVCQETVRQFKAY